MTRVVYDINATDEYIPHETPVCFCGSPNLNTLLPGFEQYYQITGSHINTSISSYPTYEYYLQYVLNIPIKMVDRETHFNIEQLHNVIDMPNYPAEGSIQFVEGVLVVKMFDYDK